jgi:hypothetical protein
MSIEFPQNDFFQLAHRVIGPVILVSSDLTLALNEDRAI